MSGSRITRVPLPEFRLWEKIRDKRVPSTLELEITARCNNNCRHCYINLPAGDKKAECEELSIESIREIADEAVSLGAVWCLMTGGEPLLREDFPDIYLCLKKMGLLVSVFTNATLVTRDHVGLFKRYPPREIEVTVYGVTRKTYEEVTRKSGSYDAFMRGLNLLLDAGVRVRLKSMVLRSNVHELPEIARFCREKGHDAFRFDPFLHLRYDGDRVRNGEIRAERLSPDEIAGLERMDRVRFEALEKECAGLMISRNSRETGDHLFSCGAGTRSFSISYDGIFRLCPSLWHPDCVYDLKEGNLKDAWFQFVPRVRDMRSERNEFLSTCKTCRLVDLCMWCPAHAHLEAGELDAPVAYFCDVAGARLRSLET